MFSALAFVVATASAAPSWSDIQANAAWAPDSEVSTSDAGTVKIATASIGGITCFRAQTSTDATVDALVSTVTDIKGTLKWSTAGVTEAELLAQSGTSYQYYQYLDVPGWTMSADRFWFLQGTLSKGPSTLFRWERLVDGGTFADKYKTVKTAHPDAVEPPVNVGAWQFDGASPVNITYFLCTDTGGAIPVFVQTAATRRTLPDTLSDAVREAKRRM